MENGLRNTHTSFEDTGWKFWKKRRYLVAILVFAGNFNNNAFRVNLSMAIVDMTEMKNVTLPNGTVISTREFDWDTKLQGYILSSFFYGYLLTQLIGGYLGMRFGGTKVFGLGVAATAALTLVTPWLVRLNVYLFLVIRIFEGIFEGLAIPCAHEIWSKWVPPLERTRLVVFSSSGFYVGIVVAMSSSALLINTFGWPSVFYTCGALGLVWYLLWILIVADTPQQDPHINDKELKYITESLNSTDNKKRSKIPWKALLTSGPVWAIIVAQSSEVWGFYTLLTHLPKFMKRVLKFNLKDTGFLCALPYVVLIITTKVSSLFADWFQLKGIFTTTQVRKMFTCGGFVAQMIFTMGAAFWMTPFGIIFCLTTAVGFGGIELNGHGVNHLDIATNYAAILFGVSNTFAGLSAAISPTLVGYIVTNEYSPEEWRRVFFTSSAVYLWGALIYGIFGSGEIQPWAVVDDRQAAGLDEEEERHKLTNT